MQMHGDVGERRQPLIKGAQLSENRHAQGVRETDH